jgi:hypothetical protein
MAFHCIVNQENLGAKSFPGFQHVMSVVTKVENFIWPKGRLRFYTVGLNI